MGRVLVANLEVEKARQVPSSPVSYNRAEEQMTKRQLGIIGLGALSVMLAACGADRGNDAKKTESAGAEHAALLGVNGVWTQQGPGPTNSGQVENLASNPPGFPATNPNGNQVVGSVQALVARPGDANRLVVGGANGGVWTTNNALANPPTWTPRGDHLASMSIGYIAMDRTNQDVLVAGFAAVSSFFGRSGPLAGLVRSTDFGVTWAPITTTSAITPVGKSVRAVTVSGSTLLVGDRNGGGIIVSTDGGTTFTHPATAPFGSVYDIQADPSATDRYYAGLSGGVFRTDDAGQTWVNASGPTTCAAPQPADCNLLSQNVALGVSNLRVTVTSNGRVFAVVTNGQPTYVGFSDDLGATWTPMDLPRLPEVAGTAISNVTGGVGSTITVTTASPHGLSTNQRVRISGVTGDLAANGDFSITVPPANPPGSATTFTLATCLTTPNCSTLNSAAYTGGGSYTTFSSSNPKEGEEDELAQEAGGQSGTHLAIIADPTTPNIVYLSGDRQDFPNIIGATDFSSNIWRGNINVARTGTLPGTLPGPTGAIPSPQWAHMGHSNAVAAIPGGGTAQGSAGHADSRNMVFDGNGNLVEVDDGGIYRRTSPLDNTGDWSSVIGNLAVTELHDVAFDPISNTIIGGAQDTGCPQQTAPGSLTWFDFTTADGGDTKVDPFSVAPNSLRYTSTQGFGGASRCSFNASNQRQTCNGLLLNLRCPGPATCGTNPVDAAPVNFPFVTPIELNVNDPANPQRLIIIAGNSAYESNNGGDTIFQVRDAAGNPVGGNAVAIAAGHPLNPELLYVGGPLRVRTTAAGGLTLTGTQPPNGSVSDIALNATDAAVAYVVTSNGVSFTTDTGAHWTDITGDLFSASQQRAPGTLRAIQFIPGSPDKIYVGADGGVFVSSTASLKFWNRVGTATFPNALVLDSDYDAAGDRLVAGTLGRGAWTLANASTLNLPAAAQCKPATVPADAACLGHATAADVDNGSFDPEGGQLNLSLAPPGPFTLGAHPVTLQVTDTSGATETCSSVVTVIDVTPPAITPPPNVTVAACLNGQAITVGTATATDNCSHPPNITGLVTAKNGVPLVPPIPVVGGQVTLGIGVFTITWTASDGVNTSTATQTVNVGTAIQASQSFLVDDRAQIRNAGSGFASVLNSGSGATRIGNDGRSGSILSVGAVTVQHRATVTGDVTSASTIFKDGDATITGISTQLASVVLPPLPPLPGFPAPTLGTFTVNAGTTQTRGPGSYQAGTVNGGTLILQAGDYFFQSLTLNSSSIIRVQPTTRIFVRDTLIFNAPFLTAAGAGIQRITLGYAGANPLSMLAVFNGTLIAPNAAVNFGTGSGLVFTGSFFARIIEVNPASQLVCSPI